LNQEDRNHLNSSVTSNEIKAIINKSPEPVGFTAKFYHTFTEELISTHLQLFHEVERERTLPNSFYEANIILIPKLDKGTTTKKREL
jgi:hypothetical protein